MRLANSVGIIDAGYRGDLIAAVDTIGLFGSTDIWHVWKETLSPIKKYDRYFQVCAPDLSPFMVHIVDTEQELSPPTARGQGGFGSTGV
jgi:dUTP pyrophosphatase